ncbi:5-oxoprolinase subunit PxpA [Flavivirga rizhaonensis]|uniref:5-oxoprolinase subunit PxpA n=1 Tax=Flavivirga rizhaonensis TaxID=2559571 RepID=A0A4S1DTS2_9FLAO|nr:5-oxoprolinase subunit PxpA [Flavivirga rizhaonensis]TGV01440.1 5-oxoprolinase subunit PxpA [Flavivirga rizhaonensis]
MIPCVIDINVDMGEGIGNESELIPFISSCNIACGGHAGDVDTMRNITRLAKKHRVKIGAHPSFPDKVNFGRIHMEMSCAALFKSVKGQVDDLVFILKEEHGALHHIKPHGALYNLAAVDEKVANVIVEVMKTIMLPVKLYVPYKSVIEKIATAQNIPIVYEAFADRNYNDDLTLVSRKEIAASIHNEDHLFEHIFHMISKQKVKTITGKTIGIKAQTFCIHGDNPNAVNLIKNLEVRLKNHGIQIR